MIAKSASFINICYKYLYPYTFLFSQDKYFIIIH
jgi:hypothetical protein